MEQPTGIKLCECGCGQPAPLAPYTNKRRGYVKGQPMRFAAGHTGKGILPAVEVGQRFGMGVVIETGLRLPRKGKPQSTLLAARLACDCGTQYTGLVGDLHYGKVKSCGCLKARGARFVDREGQRYGSLVVIRHAGRPSRDTPNKSALWLCKCDCGTEVIANGGTLASGATVSCGCSRRKPRDAQAPQRAARNRVLNGYQNGARRRGLIWTLTDDDFDRLTSQNCFYCGLPPSTVRRAGQYKGGEFVHNGIDRKDSSLGYVAENVLPCCELCNRAKMDRPFDEFMAWIARLTEYHFFHPELTPSHLLKGGA